MPDPHSRSSEKYRPFSVPQRTRFLLHLSIYKLFAQTLPKWDGQLEHTGAGYNAGELETTGELEGKSSVWLPCAGLCGGQLASPCPPSLTSSFSLPSAPQEGFLLSFPPPVTCAHPPLATSVCFFLSGSSSDGKCPSLFQFPGAGGSCSAWT